MLTACWRRGFLEVFLQGSAIGKLEKNIVSLTLLITPQILYEALVVCIPSSYVLERSDFSLVIVVRVFGIICFQDVRMWTMLSSSLFLIGIKIAISESHMAGARDSHRYDLHYFRDRRSQYVSRSRI